MSAPLLSARHLSKRFGKAVHAVDDVSLELAAGETLGIVGESGSGKSTTAKLILRLLDADGGTIEFEGRDLRKLRGGALRAIRRRLQLVPQNPQTSFNPRLTIGQSIAFNLVVHGTGRRDAQTRTAALLDRVGVVSDHARKLPRELSGGQLQRCAIARALATDPVLVVCDEAVSALDKSVQAQVLNLFSELQREIGVAFLFISHDLAVVEHLADRVLVMQHGRVVEEGSALDIWQRPAEAYTRALLDATPERILARRTALTTAS
jgi:peptide/nickel transport system ATP-binding protein/oligopeptide transport system ATP-binding protein